MDDSDEYEGTLIINEESPEINDENWPNRCLYSNDENAEKNITANKNNDNKIKRKYTKRGLWFKELSKEEREVILKQERKTKYANLTLEQRKKRLEYRRRWYANLSQKDYDETFGKRNKKPRIEVQEEPLNLVVRQSESIVDPAERLSTVDEQEGVKSIKEVRKRGRPKKITRENSDLNSKENECVDLNNKVFKRKRGRPKKNTYEDSNVVISNVSKDLVLPIVTEDSNVVLPNISIVVSENSNVIIPNVVNENSNLSTLVPNIITTSVSNVVSEVVNVTVPIDISKDTNVTVSNVVSEVSKLGNKKRGRPKVLNTDLCNREDVKEPKRRKKRSDSVKIVEKEPVIVEESKDQHIILEKPKPDVEVKLVDDNNKKNKKRCRFRNNLSEIQRKNIAKCHKDWFNKWIEDQKAINAVYTKKFNGSSSKEQLKKWRSKQFDAQNPLKYLIRRVVTEDGKLSIIPELDKKIFRRILQMFSIDYPIDVLLQKNYTKQHLCYEIDVKCLIESLMRWKGWKKFNNLTSRLAYEDLYCHLYNNLQDIHEITDSTLQDELKDCKPKNYIEVSCSLKELQSLFYFQPRNNINYYQEHMNLSYLHRGNKFPHYIFNWPFISVQITLPNFSMTHENAHSNNFHLIDIGRNINKNKFKQNTDTFSRLCSNGDESKIISTPDLTKFLRQMTIAVHNQHKKKISYDRKTELTMVIDEFQKNIIHCSETMETNTTYHINLNPFPYVRYLGCPDDERMKILIPQQKGLHHRSQFNVRLRQTCEPKINFVLNKFDVVDGDDTFTESFVQNIDDCVCYKCILCNEVLGTHSTSQKLSDHLIKYHGIEPQWECAGCGDTFNTSFLSLKRWGHVCSAQPKREVFVR